MLIRSRLLQVRQDLGDDFELPAAASAALDLDIALTYSQVNADGTTASGASTFKLDGKDYAITGSPDYDTLSLMQLKGSTVRNQQKKNGKVVGSTMRSVSADGRVRSHRPPGLFGPYSR